MQSLKSSRANGDLNIVPTMPRTNQLGEKKDGRQSKTYSNGDCAVEGGTFVTGTAEFSKYGRPSSKKLSSWIEKYEKIKKSRQTAIPPSGDSSLELFAISKLESLAKEMNSRII